MLKIAIAAGGTGGHIIPALSIANKFIQSNAKVIYIGNKNSLEEKLVKQNNISFFAIDVQKLYRKLTIKHIKFPFKLIKAVIDCIKIFRQQKPDCFIGAGGFVSGPAGIAALILGIPFFLQEQNSYVGITNRFLSKFAKKIYTGFKTVTNISNKKCVYLGNPIKYDFLNINKQEIFKKFNLNINNKTILITGGSQGSSAINSCVEKVLPGLLKSNFNVIWQTGKFGYNKYKHLCGKGVYVFDFSTNIHSFFAVSNFAITRAGALTIAELESYKLPAVLIPYPYAAGNHQLYNAQQQQNAKKAIVLSQNKLTPDSLLQNITKINTSLQNYKKSDFSDIHILASKNIVQDIIKQVKK